jgi:hypothetical protein
MDILNQGIPGKTLTPEKKLLDFGSSFFIILDRICAWTTTTINKPSARHGNVYG